ncbi:NRDE-2, necessary for RNA interference-domain-containing protein [Baffinella frigidus]|nr:NRDE-2, necessary for RNA interference-domain-containing protein [Cryptophyta sp. CCMP2293]
MVAITEKKVAILLAALRANPDSEPLLEAYLNTVQDQLDPDRLALPLLEAYLNTVQDQLDPDRLAGLWEAVVAKHAGRPRLWRAYLLHRKRYFKTFSVGAMRAAFTSLASLEEAIVSQIEELFELERQAGYTERGLALLQALVELNCFAPPTLAGDATALRRAFKTFWESDAPRVGDAGAGGFDVWWAAAQAAAVQAAHDAVAAMHAAAAAAADSC